MTCIVAIIEQKENNRHRVTMAGDSAGENGWLSVHRLDPKVFQNGEFLIGFTSSFRMGQLLRYAFKPPEIKGDLVEYMVVDFVNAVRQSFKDGGYASKKDEVEAGGEFLIAIHGRLFKIQSDYNVGENTDGFDAIGGGAQIALGTLFVLKDTNYFSTEEKLTMALNAAEHFNNGVRRPFYLNVQMEQ